MGPTYVRRYCEALRIAVEEGNGSVLKEIFEELTLEFTEEERTELWFKLRSYERRMIKELQKSYETGDHYEFHGWLR